MTTLTIVIVAWNAREDLERCLESLTAHPPRTAHELVVVDNRSTDGAPDMVAARFPHVRLMRAAGNLGFAAGNNLALRETASELVLLLNPDTVVPEGAVDHLVQRIRALPRVGAIGPRLVDEQGRPERSFGPVPTPVGELQQKVIGWLWRREWPGIARWAAWATSRERRVRWVSGACLLLRRVDLVSVGLLDDRYFLYWEDVDLCLALEDQGREVWFSPAATVVHRRGRSMAGSPRGSRRAYRSAQLAFYRKHQPGWVPWLRAYLRVIGEWPDRESRGAGGDEPTA